MSPTDKLRNVRTALMVNDALISDGDGVRGRADVQIVVDGVKDHGLLQ